MNFLHTWAIGIGAAALLAPIAVHFLTRPKPVAYRLSTVRFLQEVIEQRRAKSRLRDWLILLLRAVCIALLALALARPLLDRPPAVPHSGASGAQRVIIIDASQSMSAGSGGITSWNSAVASARQFLDGTPGMRAGVIFCGARAHSVFDQLSPNISALHEAIQQAIPLAERAEPRAALEQAAALFAKSGEGTKELVIISDFQRGNWGTLLLDLIPQDTRVQFHSVAQALTENVAITDFRFAAEPIVGQPAVLEVEVANYSDREVALRCTVEINTLKRTLEAQLLPNSTRRLSETLVLEETGWKFGWAKLESNLDVLPDDDKRPIAVRVRPPVSMLLVSRQNAQQVPSSSFYLEHALNVALSSDSTTDASGAHSERTLNAESSSQVKHANPRPQAISRVHSRRDHLRTWPECDVIVLDHPGALSDETLQFLAAQVRRGKGLLYVTAELVDAINLERLSQLLGSEYQPPVELVPVSDSDVRKGLFVRRAKDREAPFSVLARGNVTEALRPVRFEGGLSTRATAEGLRDQVLAELSDTSALLYLSSVGMGQIAVLNTDLARSNWPVQPTFLPVMGELSKILTHSRQSESTHSGEPLVRMLPAEVTDSSQLSARALSGPPPKVDFGDWEWVTSQSSMVWNWQEPPGPGVYALESRSVPVCMIATSAPAMEADLSSLDEAILTELAGTSRNVGYSLSDSVEKPADNLWSWLIVVCLIGLTTELFALRAHRM